MPPKLTSKNTKTVSTRENVGLSFRDEAAIKRDPYGLCQPACSINDHQKLSSNCWFNPTCLYGLGEFSRGIWPNSPKMLTSLEYDPCLNFRDVRRNPAGLYNLGSTCYMNVSLQSLFFNLPFRSAILNWKPHPLLAGFIPERLAKMSTNEVRPLSASEVSEIEAIIKRNCSSLSRSEDVSMLLGNLEQYIHDLDDMLILQKLFVDLQFSPDRAITTKSFVLRLRISENIQEDVAEFLKKLFELIDPIFRRSFALVEKSPSIRMFTQLRANNTPQDLLTRSPSISLRESHGLSSILKQMQGKYKTIIECSRCHHRISTVDSYDVDGIRVPVRSFSSLEHALASRFSEEKMYGSNAFACSRCASEGLGRQDATSSVQFDVLPDVLNIQLLRTDFSVSSGRQAKIHSHIHVPDILDFGAVLMSTSSKTFGSISESNSNASSAATPTRTELGEKSEPKDSVSPLSEDLRRDPHIYELSSVIYHVGTDSQRGHYVMDVWDYERCVWWHIDDSSVRLLSSSMDSFKSAQSRKSNEDSTENSKTSSIGSGSRKSKSVVGATEGLEQEKGVKRNKNAGKSKGKLKKTVSAGNNEKEQLLASGRRQTNEARSVRHARRASLQEHLSNMKEDNDSGTSAAVVVSLDDSDSNNVVEEVALIGDMSEEPIDVENDESGTHSHDHVKSTISFTKSTESAELESKRIEPDVQMRAVADENIAINEDDPPSKISRGSKNTAARQSTRVQSDHRSPPVTDVSVSLKKSKAQDATNLSDAVEREKSHYEPPSFAGRFPSVHYVPAERGSGDILRFPKVDQIDEHTPTGAVEEHVPSLKSPFYSLENSNFVRTFSKIISRMPAIMSPEPSAPGSPSETVAVSPKEPLVPRVPHSESELKRKTNRTSSNNIKDGMDKERIAELPVIMPSAIPGAFPALDKGDLQCLADASLAISSLTSTSQSLRSGSQRNPEVVEATYDMASVIPVLFRGYSALAAGSLPLNRSTPVHSQGTIGEDAKLGTASPWISPPSFVKYVDSLHDPQVHIPSEGNGTTGTRKRLRTDSVSVSSPQDGEAVLTNEIRMTQEEWMSRRAHPLLKKDGFATKNVYILGYTRIDSSRLARWPSMWNLGNSGTLESETPRDHSGEPSRPTSTVLGSSDEDDSETSIISGDRELTASVPSIPDFYSQEADHYPSQSLSQLQPPPQLLPLPVKDSPTDKSSVVELLDSSFDSVDSKSSKRRGGKVVSRDSSMSLSVLRVDGTPLRASRNISQLKDGDTPKIRNISADVIDLISVSGSTNSHSQGGSQLFPTQHSISSPAPNSSPGKRNNEVENIEANVQRKSHVLPLPPPTISTTVEESAPQRRSSRQSAKSASALILSISESAKRSSSTTDFHTQSEIEEVDLSISKAKTHGSGKKSRAASSAKKAVNPKGAEDDEAGENNEVSNNSVVLSAKKSALKKDSAWNSDFQLTSRVITTLPPPPSSLSAMIRSQMGSLTYSSFLLNSDDYSDLSANNESSNEESVSKQHDSLMLSDMFLTYVRDSSKKAIKHAIEWHVEYSHRIIAILKRRSMVKRLLCSLSFNMPASSGGLYNHNLCYDPVKGYVSIPSTSSKNEDVLSGEIDDDFIMVPVHWLSAYYLGDADDLSRKISPAEAVSSAHSVSEDLNGKTVAGKEVTKSGDELVELSDSDEEAGLLNRRNSGSRASSVSGQDIISASDSESSEMTAATADGALGSADENDGSGSEDHSKAKASSRRRRQMVRLDDKEPVVQKLQGSNPLEKIPVISVEVLHRIPFMEGFPSDVRAYGGSLVSSSWKNSGFFGSDRGAKGTGMGHVSQSYAYMLLSNHFSVARDEALTKLRHLDTPMSIFTRCPSQGSHDELGKCLKLSPSLFPFLKRIPRAWFDVIRADCFDSRSSTAPLFFNEYTNALCLDHSNGVSLSKTTFRVPEFLQLHRLVDSLKVVHDVGSAWELVSHGDKQKDDVISGFSSNPILDSVIISSMKDERSKSKRKPVQNPQIENKFLSGVQDVMYEAMKELLNFLHPRVCEVSPIASAALSALASSSRSFPIARVGGVSDSSSSPMEVESSVLSDTSSIVEGGVENLTPPRPLPSEMSDYDVIVHALITTPLAIMKHDHSEMEENSSNINISMWPSNQIKLSWLPLGSPTSFMTLSNEKASYSLVTQRKGEIDEKEHSIQRFLMEEAFLVTSRNFYSKELADAHVKSISTIIGATRHVDGLLDALKHSSFLWKPVSLPNIVSSSFTKEDTVVSPEIEWPSFIPKMAHAEEAVEILRRLSSSIIDVNSATSVPHVEHQNDTNEVVDMDNIDNSEGGGKLEHVWLSKGAVYSLQRSLQCLREVLSARSLKSSSKLLRMILRSFAMHSALVDNIANVALKSEPTATTVPMKRKKIELHPKKTKINPDSRLVVDSRTAVHPTNLRASDSINLDVLLKVYPSGIHAFLLSSIRMIPSPSHVPVDSAESSTSDVVYEAELKTYERHWKRFLFDENSVISHLRSIDYATSPFILLPPLQRLLSGTLCSHGSLRPSALLVKFPVRTLVVVLQLYLPILATLLTVEASSRTSSGNDISAMDRVSLQDGRISGNEMREKNGNAFFPLVPSVSITFCEPSEDDKACDICGSKLHRQDEAQRLLNSQREQLRTRRFSGLMTRSRINAGFPLQGHEELPRAGIYALLPRNWLQNTREWVEKGTWKPYFTHSALPFQNYVHDASGKNFDGIDRLASNAHSVSKVGHESAISPKEEEVTKSVFASSQDWLSDSSVSDTDAPLDEEAASSSDSGGFGDGFTRQGKRTQAIKDSTECPSFSDAPWSAHFCFDVECSHTYGVPLPSAEYFTDIDSSSDRNSRFRTKNVSTSGPIANSAAPSTSKGMDGHLRGVEDASGVISLDLDDDADTSVEACSNNGRKNEIGSDRNMEDDIVSPGVHSADTVDLSVLPHPSVVEIVDVEGEEVDFRKKRSPYDSPSKDDFPIRQMDLRALFDYQARLLGHPTAGLVDSLSANERSDENWRRSDIGKEGLPVPLLHVSVEILRLLSDLGAPQLFLRPSDARSATFRSSLRAALQYFHTQVLDVPVADLKRVLQSPFSMELVSQHEFGDLVERFPAPEVLDQEKVNNILKVYGQRSGSALLSNVRNVKSGKSVSTSFVDLGASVATESSLETQDGIVASDATDLPTSNSKLEEISSTSEAATVSLPSHVSDISPIKSDLFQMLSSGVPRLRIFDSSSKMGSESLLMSELKCLYGDIFEPLNILDPFLENSPDSRGKEDEGKGVSVGYLVDLSGGETKSPMAGGVQVWPPICARWFLYEMALLKDSRASFVNGSVRVVELMQGNPLDFSLSSASNIIKKPSRSSSLNGSTLKSLNVSSRPVRGCRSTAAYSATGIGANPSVGPTSGGSGVGYRKNRLCLVEGLRFDSTMSAIRAEMFNKWNAPEVLEAPLYYGNRVILSSDSERTLFDLGIIDGSILFFKPDDFGFVGSDFDARRSSDVGFSGSRL